MHPAPPANLELAHRLRYLRREHWPEARLTQAALARALGQDKPLSPATVASWESTTAPKLPPRDKILAYAAFFATRRSLEGEPSLLPLDGFTDEEQATHKKLLEDLLRLHSAARGGTESDTPTAARRSWHFTDSGPLTLVCAKLPDDQVSALADQDNPNYTQLAGFGDVDAMVELHGHVRAENPGMEVFYKAAPDVKADDLSGHVVIIGGIGWNDVTRRLIDLSRLPVRQINDPEVETGEPFVIPDGEGKGRPSKYLPQWSPESGRLMVDVGLLVRMPNPLNSNRTITMCNGIHSRGVLGAVRTLTDARLRESNEQYIARTFPDDQFGILMRVQVIEGETLTPDFNIPGTVLYQWPVKA
jgi:transcriptional regulator with XRE-family HTH domain